MVGEQENEMKKIDPIVFLNTPINDENKDAIGILSSVDAVQRAVDDGAKMIGIIAEYGAGKSSLTEMLAKSNKYNGVIRVNMWDSMHEKNDSDDKISCLTKSFIYQLAIGCSKRAANYVNKILNDNYSVISFGVGYIRTWILFAFAGFFVMLYFLFSNIEIRNFVRIFHESSRVLGLRLQWIAPAVGVVGVALAALGVYFSSFVLSNWKDSGNRKTGINEVFTAYSYVYGLLLRNKKPYIIIIDDLDRIEEKDSIIGFLKELYRFNNLYTDKKKKAPVFVISIAPETELKENRISVNTSNGDNKPPHGSETPEKLYSKIFDYIISLKPIHYDDYRVVISQIFKSEPDKTSRLNEILNAKDEITDESLPNSFEWLYRGDNLTLRELKERLNKAIGLFIELKNKDYEGNPSISFKTCVCVTYLEREYPAEYYQILRSEKCFSALIQESCVYKNDENRRNEQSIKALVMKKFPDLQNEKLYIDLARLIYEGVIDTDYRMYFYSFPKGSYIKDIDEKDVCNYLEFPRDYKYDVQAINVQMERLEGKNKIATIEAVINRLGNTEDIMYFPKVIFEHRDLWYLAYKNNPKKCVSSLNYYLDWGSGDVDECIRILENIFQQKSETEKELLNIYKHNILNSYFLMSVKEIVLIRTSIYKVFKEDKKFMEDFYLTDKAPFITEEEVYTIYKPSSAIYLIKEDLLNGENYQYIQEGILNHKIPMEAHEKALRIQKAIVKIATFENVADGVYEFLYYNHLVDYELFVPLCRLVEKDIFDSLRLCEYINQFSAEELNDVYYKEINELCLTRRLKEEIIQCLIRKGLYATPILHYVTRNEVDKFDFSKQTAIMSILDACELIKTSHPNLMTQIRTAIIKRHNGDMPKTLEDVYKGNYPICTVSELREFKDFETGLSLLDASKFTEQNVDEYINYINEGEHLGEECFNIFDWLFNSKYGELVCGDKLLITKIVDELNYSKVIFASMSEEQINGVVEILEAPLKLTDADSARVFMLTAKFLARKLEVRVLQIQGLDKYIELINELNMVSDFAVETILSHPPKYRLNSNITNRLWQEKKYDYYIVGETLYNGKLFFPEVELEGELVALYNEKSPIFQYYVDSEKFLIKVMRRCAYRQFSSCTYAMLQPFYKLKQTSDFLNFVLDTLQAPQVREYLLELNEIVDDKNSNEISKILAKPEYIKYIADEDVYEHVKFRLWDNSQVGPGHKGNLTRKRNDYLKKIGKIN